MDDPFLKALADGGHQVGELAKCYHPGGIEIETLDYEEALKETQELLKRDQVIIFEAAVSYQNLFVRVDILIKKGNSIELLEVKAKSFDREDENFFVGKRGGFDKKKLPYLRDIAFQTYVVRHAYPRYQVMPYLYLVDKCQVAATSGLNQKFILKKEGKRVSCVVSESLSEEDLRVPLLKRVPVEDYVLRILSEPLHDNLSFSDSVGLFSTMYADDVKIPTPPGAKCSSCEFRASKEELDRGLKSGFLTCISEQMGCSVEKASQPSVLEIASFLMKDKLIAAGIFFLEDVEQHDINPTEDKNKAGLSQSERQWLQIQKIQQADTTAYIERPGLRAEFQRLNYPLHFIDFETTAVPIPFNKGRRPYEGLAFQFSHHTMQADGSIEHKTEYLDVRRGHFPNYDFVRALKAALGESGSIFRYATHENTYLNKIYSQMREDDSVADRDELMSFIRSVSRSTEDSSEKWQGPRSMIDLCEWVKRYYYDPATGGSNSIKKVLPAVLNSSQYLQEKYSQPIYGDSIVSKNFRSFSWIVRENGSVKDPYKLLPKLFEGIPEQDEELWLYENEELKDGGAALIAYAKLQFTEISEIEKAELSNALLRYCELDTLAMVMIFEALREWIRE